MNPDPGSSQLRHRGQRAVQRMVEFAPSSGSLALWVRHRDLAEDDPACLAAGAPGRRAPVFTDGLSLLYTPEFGALSLDLQTGWVAHEVLHVALRHAQRFVELQTRLGHADLPLFNLCADAIVNSALAPLTWLALPEDAPRLEKLLAETLGVEPAADAALLEWDVERLYRAIDDRASGRMPVEGDADPSSARRGRDAGGDRRGRTPRPDDGAGQRDPGSRAARLRALAAAQPLDLQPSAESGGAPQDEAEQAREWTERLLRAQAGDGPLALLRVPLADLPRVRTPWEQVLRTQVARALSIRPGLSWSRPSRSYLANQGRAGPGRRLPWEPGTTSAQRVARLALVVDTSGSIDDALLARFNGELEALVRRLEASLVVVVGDCTVQQVVHVDPGRAARPSKAVVEWKGGGGTDFTPLLEEADRHDPDLVVVLTDLDGPARHVPRCPVLWAVPEAHRRAVAPFGRLLVLR